MFENLNFLDPFNTLTISKWLHTLWTHLMRTIRTWAICRGPKVKNLLFIKSADWKFRNKSYLIQDRLIFAGHFHAPRWYELLVLFSSRSYLKREKLIKRERRSASNLSWKKKITERFEILSQWSCCLKNYTKMTILKRHIFEQLFQE